MKYIALLFLSGCGIHISSDPIIVTHKLDLSLIEPLCKERCINDIDPTFCTAKCVNDFLLTLGGVSVK
jgi:hypothetical protein